MDEYQELRDAGLTDDVIQSMRNTGATHAAILLWARKRMMETAHQAVSTNGIGWTPIERMFAHEIIRREDVE